MDTEPERLYDNYVSLGSSCEVAFQFRRVLGDYRSGFFNWNITPVQSLLSLLAQDFSGILQAENLSHSDGNLFYDASHGYCFHADFSSPDLRADGMFEARLTSLREKTEHFLQTFRTLSQRGRTVFFIARMKGRRRTKI